VQPHSTSVAAALLRDDVEETLEGVLEGHDFLDGGVALGQLLEQQQALWQTTTTTTNTTSLFTLI